MQPPQLVTFEIKQRNNFIWNWNKIISATEGVIKLFQNCPQAMNMLENIQSGKKPVQ